MRDVCPVGYGRAVSFEHLTRALAPVMPQVLTPLLVVDLDAARHNVRQALARFGPDGWRPHVKTAKQSAVIGAAMTEGVTRFKVATLVELTTVLEAASALSRAVDVLIAYPLRGPAIAAALDIAARFPKHRVRWLSDDPEHATELTSRGVGSLGIDVDLGMDRTGTPPETWSSWISAAPDDVLDRVELVHGYDGHHRFDEEQRAHAAYDRLCTVGRALIAVRPETSLELVTSGTHSYGLARSHEGLASGRWRATVSPGTIVLSDGRSAPAHDDLGLRQAALVLARVISRGVDRITMDAGSKAIAPDYTPSCRLPDWPGIEPGRASEEHLPCTVPPGSDAPAPGELVWLIPEHVCTTVNLHRDVALVEDGRVRRGTIEARARRAWVDAPELRGL
jgi:D-serine deaminase-like pyridoxal phosphate-dependent protein